MHSPLTYQIAISLLPKIGAIHARKLIAYMGGVEPVFEASEKAFQEVPGIGKQLIKLILSNRGDALRKAQKELEFIHKYQLKSFFYLDKNYPKRLAQCEDAPVILFMKGGVNLNAARIVSIVGTRNASAYGKEQTEALVAGLAAADKNTLIVSGLAYGIDVAAHKAAIKYELPTMGVVGHGLDKMYPAAHAAIAKDMVRKGGAMLSDFTSGIKIDPGNFIRRNRIVAGLADCTVVVESATKGGALVTADIANSYNRDVFAFPGRTDDLYSAGCNMLIKKSQAALIESAQDLLDYMGWETSNNPVQQSLPIDLNETEKETLTILSSREITTTDALSRKLNIPVQEVNAMILNLEFKGMVKSLPGNRIKLLLKH